MNWGDMLAGVEITPENWAGGVVERNGHWQTWFDVYTKRSTIAEHTPIFPPRGWAGKTDAELWREVFGEHADLGAGVLMYRDKYQIDHLVQIANDEALGSQFPRPGNIGRWASKLPALILALQNAQVLARRLAQTQEVAG